MSWSKIFVAGVVCMVGFGARADEVPDLETALRATYTACVGIDEELAGLKKMAGINTAVDAVGAAAGAGAVSTDILARDKTGWRIGVKATGAAANAAGAVIAGKNKVDEDLETQIEDCKWSVKILQDSIIQAKMNGEDVSEAKSIADACTEFNYIDISPINKRAKGAMIANTVGAATGAGAAVTAAVIDDDTVSGSLSVAQTAASATAIVFNATQISAIKKVAAIAEKCTEVLK